MKLFVVRQMLRIRAIPATREALWRWIEHFLPPDGRTVLLFVLFTITGYCRASESLRQNMSCAGCKAAENFAHLRLLEQFKDTPGVA